MSNLDPSETTRHAPYFIEGEDMVLRIEETKSEIPCRVGTAQIESDLDVKLAYNGGVLAGDFKESL